MDMLSISMVLEKITENYTHWLSVYTDTIQMYCYKTDDDDMTNVYDTGMLNINSNELQILIDIFTANFKTI